MIAVTTVDWVPPFAHGHLRDLRLRWALEEAGLAYEMRFVPLMGRDAPDYRALQPFGQIPVYEEDGRAMFETVAVLLHLSEKSAALAPADADGRAEMTTWLFAALNTVEPPLQHLKMVDVFHRNQDWRAAHRPSAVEAAQKRLGDLAKVLDGRDFIAAGRFTVADIAMATVLRIVNHTDMVAQHAPLARYLSRSEERPAFQTALAGQLADIAAHTPKG